MGSVDHRLDHEAVDAGVGQLGLDAREHLARRLLRGHGTLEPEADAPDIGFVRDVGGGNLDYACLIRGAESRWQWFELRPRLSPARPFRGDAIGCEYRLGFECRRDFADGAQDPLDFAVGFLRVVSPLAGGGGRRLHELGLCSRIADQLHEAGDGFGCRRECRDIGCSNSSRGSFAASSPSQHVMTGLS